MNAGPLGFRAHSEFTRSNVLLQDELRILKQLQIWRSLSAKRFALAKSCYATQTADNVPQQSS